jgi:4-hydroxybenzoate polyprenyltransferase
MRRFLPYAQLMRLPNVFTALADIGLGWLAVWATAPSSAGPAFLWLMASSACLYSAGMVWNDFFDLEQDRRERPFRPLPSGRIRRGAAGLLGAALLALGLAFAAAAGQTSLAIAGLLVVAILAYDAWLKRTVLGPVAMGTCRFLNVLLGLSLADPAVWPWFVRGYVAFVVGLYIVGVTWFARTEARASSQAALASAACVMLAALGLGLAVPTFFEGVGSSALFPYLLVAFGFVLAVPICKAVKNPAPKHVQAAVKRAVLGLVALDAILATAIAGTVGLVLLALLLPAMYLGRWLYST